MALPDPQTSAPDMLERARGFLAEDLHFAIIATINADGGPHQAVVWYTFDGATILINSAEGRTWPANLQRDPRISLTVEDDYRWVSIRGSVDVLDDQAAAQATTAAMARRYHGDEPDRAEALIRDRFELQRRISFRLTLATSRLHFEE